MSHPNPDELLSFDEIEAEFKVSRSTVHRRRRAGHIKPLEKVGDRKLYFRRRDVEELLKPRIVEDQE